MTIQHDPLHSGAARLGNANVGAEDFDGLALLDEALFADGRVELPVGEGETVQEVAEQTSYGAVLLDDLIHRQLALAGRVATIFLVLLLAVPLVNRIFPSVVADCDPRPGREPMDPPRLAATGAAGAAVHQAISAFSRPESTVRRNALALAAPPPV